MAKNGKLVTAMLDSHAETIRLLKSRRLEDVQAGVGRVEAQLDLELWMACLEDGWTIAELGAALDRRFGRQEPIR
jgi:hypothetical protein